MISQIRRLEHAHGVRVDFVLQVGDLEPHRDERDMASMKASAKHRTGGDFYRVVSGDLPLPWPMYFIGGNHEPWEFLDSHDGASFELARNVHFLGRGTVVDVGPLRVAALSGIDGVNTYRQPRPHFSQFRNVSNKVRE
jgi:lariat debranching enzyme